MKPTTSKPELPSTETLDETMPKSSLLDADVIRLLKSLLARYRRMYDSQYDMPVHRETDLTVLEMLIERDDLSHQELYQKINDYFDTILTGLIIKGKERIGTGRSRLRDIFMQVFMNEYFNQSGMQKRDERRQQLVQKLNEEAKTLSSQDINLIQQLREESQLKDAVIAGQDEKIKRLEENYKIVESAAKCQETEVKRLTHDLNDLRNKMSEMSKEKATLRLKVFSLQEDNKKLKAETERLQKQYAQEQKKNETSQKENQPKSEGQRQANSCAQTVKPQSAKTVNKPSWFSSLMPK